MRNESPALARNMSAPPRTTLSFSALVPASGAGGDVVADGAGLTFVCRLDAHALLSKARRIRTEGQRKLEPWRIHDRLRVALVYARAEAMGQKRAPSGALAKACATPAETVADELGDVLALVSLADAALPKFGLFLPPMELGRAVLGSLGQTLAILARRRGTLFLRDADPIVWSAVGSDVFDLWTPAPAPGRTP